MLQQLTTALQNYWQTHFPTSVPTAFPGVGVGIHCHNDCELAVANSVRAV